MVFTRKRQAEDDAAQVNEVDEACSTAASSDTLPTAGSTINITAALTAQNGESVSASISMSTTTVPRVSDPQGNTSTAPAATKVSGKGRKKSTKGTSGEQKIKAESDDENNTANNNTGANGEVRAKRRRSNKIGSSEQRTADDSDYNPENASTVSDRPQVSARILRRRGPAPVVRSPGVITLRISPRLMAALLRKMQKKALAALRRQNPASNDRNFTFGMSELSYHPGPRQVDIRNVARILEEERPLLLAQVSQDNAARPMHAGQNFNFDAIVRVVLSQASTNEGALDAQQCIIHAYPYEVNGRKVVGTIPNYHLMRVQSLEKLELALMRAGLYKIKAKAIKRCLDDIYAHNLSLLGPEEVAYRFNVPNEPDFVPGLLSLDYLSTMFVREGKQAVFDYLVSLPLIGIKTASCIMAFRMGIPVFAVDTHVAGMAKLLGWVPQDATEEEMCSHLDFKIVDDGKKLDLHQDFWRHRRTCARCNSRGQPGSWAYENTICPLEHLITRPTPRRITGNGNRRLQPRPRVVKKKIDEDALRAQGMIKVTYQVDDDFDAASGVLVMRTVWIHDYSMLEVDVQMVKEEDEPIEEIEIGSETIRRSLDARNGLV